MSQPLAPLPRRIFLSSVASIGSTALLGCGQNHAEKLVIFAASSLTNLFRSAATQFEKKTPSTSIALQFAGTGQLVAQIRHGAQPDLLAAADIQYLAQFKQEQLLSDYMLLAQNALAVVVHPSQKQVIHSLHDLAKARRIVIAAPSVPVGKYTAQFLDNATLEFGPTYKDDVMARVVSHELNVRQVLAKVVSGEADAGIVYESDVTFERDRLHHIPISERLNVVSKYPLVRLKSAKNPALAQAFMAFMRSDEGQQLIQRSGFRPPTNQVEEL